MQFAPKNFHKKLLGRIGEDGAANYLKNLGYQIIERNFSCRFGEIDVIAKDGETLVFAEVKTRTTDKFGEPKEAVGYVKREKYYRTAEYYLLKNGITDSPCRFDVIEVKDGQINHIADAFSR